MQELHACPVCGAVELIRIGTVNSEWMEMPQTVQQGGINAILKHVVGAPAWSTWTLLCRQCRHLFLSPVFEEAELDQLYSPELTAETKRQYRESERVSGKSWAEQNNVPAADQAALRRAARDYRPRRLHELVAAMCPPGQIRKILDFGASTGELTERFPAGCRRFVYDKDLSAVADPGVVPLGSLEQIRTHGPYDLIVLSHVLEHVPFPTRLLAELRASLTSAGLLYVEVPIEYCGAVLKRRGIPIGMHVNFFSRASLLACIRMAALRCVSIRREIVPYGECQAPALKALARPGAPGQRGVGRWPWPLDLLIDALLTVCSRKARKRFQ